ncbi:MAG: inositol 2-dehydrogenase [Pseudomonadota bacterium]
MVKIGLLGCGRIGRMHADILARHPQVTLTSVYDVNAEAAREVAQACDTQVAANAEDIFADGSVDGVLVATATPTHVGFIEQAVAAGKPVLCEKPIDLDLDRVQACAQIIRGSTVPIMLGFNRRFDPGHRAVHKAAHGGDIGEIHQVIITSRDPEMPSHAYMRESGGLFRDMTIHDFDLARYMLGEEPVSVFAVGTALIDPGFGAETGEIDTAMILMQTASSRQCCINNSRRAVYGYDQRVEIHGSKGMLLSDNRRNHEARHHTATATGISEPYEFFFIERYAQAYRAEIDAFIQIIKDKTPSPVGFEDGHRALVLAEAAYKSMKDRSLVMVSEIEK